MILLFTFIFLTLSSNAFILPYSRINSPSTSTTSLYQSKVYPIYTESTDCFGIVFYANYPVYLERTLIDQQPFKSFSYSRLKSVKMMKYKSPARLGDELVFTNTDTNSMTRCVIKKTNDEIFTAKKAILCTGSINLTVPPLLNTPKKLHSFTYDVYHDELVQYNTSLSSCILPTKTIFNLFERSRTDILGGPYQLMQSSVSSDKHVYVARISDYELISDPVLLNEENQLRLTVLCHTVPIGLTAVNFFQQIVSPSKSELICRATVTCCCVDPKTGEPREFDSSFLSLFQ